jgi:ABC-type glycerol-3-phosphate transport system substrate-binding protein
MFRSLVASLLVLAISAFGLAGPTSASAAEGKLVVVTSYPPDTTEAFKQAFEKKYPG